MGQIFLQIVLPFSISLFIQFIVIKIFSRKEICIDCGETDKPQRFHFVPTPRAGGLGIFIAFIFGTLISFFYSSLTTLHSSLILSSFPAFAAGFYEDIRSNINPKLRLTIMGIGAVIGIILIESVVYDIGIFKLPLWLAIPFSIFAVVGVTNAINIIDGFNGLASGVSIIAFLAFSIVSYSYGDRLIFEMSIIMISAVAGFFVWNFPKGKIFLGDGGAYFIGFILALISVLLVNRHAELSPWFPVVILAHPIFEVLFSIYRRKFMKGTKAFDADGRHLHTLIYKRISRSNPKTSIYIWVLVSVFNLIAFPFRSNTPLLIAVFILFSIVYMSIYRRIVRFKFSL